MRCCVLIGSSVIETEASCVLAHLATDSALLAASKAAVASPAPNKNLYVGNFGGASPAALRASLQAGGRGSDDPAHLFPSSQLLRHLLFMEGRHACLDPESHSHLPSLGLGSTRCQWPVSGKPSRGGVWRFLAVSADSGRGLRTPSLGTPATLGAERYCSRAQRPWPQVPLSRRRTAEISNRHCLCTACARVLCGCALRRPERGGGVLSLICIK